jgi:hypothetical protein
MSGKKGKIAATLSRTRQKLAAMTMMGKMGFKKQH